MSPVLIPAAFAVLALGLLLYGWVAELPTLAGVLAAGGLLAAMARGGLTFRENLRLLRRSHQEALTDGLSGLANRRKLMLDLEDALIDADQHERALLFFDLDGFKADNDAFGHSAGDALLARLGRALGSAAEGRGTAYRLGGDEFCLLLDGRLGRLDAIVTSAVTALSEHGEGFNVTASYGIVQIPTEAASSEAALQLADERMYALRAQGLAPRDQPPAGARRAGAGAGRARAGAAPSHGRRRRAGDAHGPRTRARPRAAGRARPRRGAARHRQGRRCPTTSSTSPARSTTSSGGSCASTRWSASASSPPRRR